MASEVSIANVALLKIGENSLTSFSDPGKPAMLANNTFITYRDSLLRSHPWNFATRRVSLSAETATPEWEFTYAYNLPGTPHHCLRVLKIQNPNNYDWRVEGRQILTDLGSPIKIQYIWRVEDPNTWDPLFQDAFIAKLAHEWSEALAKDIELTQRLLEEYVGKIQEAFGVDGQEGKLEALPSGSWVDTFEDQ